MEKQGVVQAKIMPYIRCRSCGARATMTTWRPDRGIDSQIRQFQCICGMAWYTRVETQEEKARPAWSLL